jgi:hypothetical protein
MRGRPTCQAYPAYLSYGPKGRLFDPPGRSVLRPDGPPHLMNSISR